MGFKKLVSIYIAIFLGMVVALVVVQNISTPQVGDNEWLQSVVDYLTVFAKLGIAFVIYLFISWSITKLEHTAVKKNIGIVKYLPYPKLLNGVWVGSISIESKTTKIEKDIAFSVNSSFHSIEIESKTRGQGSKLNISGLIKEGKNWHLYFVYQVSNSVLSTRKVTGVGHLEFGGDAQIVENTKGEFFTNIETFGEYRIKFNRGSDARVYSESELLEFISDSSKKYYYKYQGEYFDINKDLYQFLFKRDQQSSSGNFLNEFNKLSGTWYRGNPPINNGTQK
ncbi:MAG: hypothetical protein KUF74_17500 [Candidatus Thiodiazotropha sp. (ex Ctena orbiculata)]|nr:hypothetical protein [Candidatus Thiodiazotropha taylori]